MYAEVLKMGGERPEQYEGSAYRPVLDMAWKGLLSKDLDEVARNAMVRRDGDRLILRTYGRECTVDTASHTIRVRDQEPMAAYSILVLHYLAGAREAAPAGRWTSYRQLPGGTAYYNAFKKRTIDEVAALFSRRPELIHRAMGALGGKRLAFGDASIQLDVFPKLPVAVILWKGDEEVRGAANVLFDETAPLHLPVEDLAEVGSNVLSQLFKAYRTVQDSVVHRNTV